MVWSFVYLALRRVLELVMLCCQQAEAKEIELLVLHHELTSCVASIRDLSYGPETGPCGRR